MGHIGRDQEGKREQPWREDEPRVKRADQREMRGAEGATGDRKLCQPYSFIVSGRFCYASHSIVSYSANPITVARQAPLSMAFSRQEHWSGLPCPSPGALPNPGIKPGSPTLQADSLPSGPPGRPLCCGTAVNWSLRRVPRRQLCWSSG